MSHQIEELELAFRRDPSDVDAFAALRRHYQAESRLDALAALFERRAAHMSEPQKAADLLWQGAEAHARRQDHESELRDLHRVVELSKGHKRALERIKVLAAEHGRWVEMLRAIELEIETLGEAGGDSKRLARLEHEAGTTWEQQFHRLDRAILCYQRAFKADPNHTESIEAGRRIYATMGHWKTVGALYQVELSTCSDARRKVDLLLELGKLQSEKLADLEAAARALSEASQLRPSDETLMESLGEVYASPEWPVPGGLDKAASIFMQVAQRRHARGDRDGAISYLRRALGADPENEAAYTRLERAYEETGRWEDLDRLYRQRLSVASEMESTGLMMKRGELLERKIGDRKGARECYEAVVAHEPLGGPASARLLELCRADEDWEKAIDLTRRVLESTQDRASRIRLMMEIAATERDHLSDPEAAAQLFHEVLQLDPEHRKALAAYEDYFRQKGDYRNLAELLRFAAQAAQDAGAPPMEICARLEELADVSERRLGDLEGAVEAWQQIAQLHPDVQRSNDALSRLAAKIRMWHGMVNVLDREIAAAASPPQRLQALRRAVQVYYEKKADPLRAIEYLREIISYQPQDEGSLRMLVDLYEREADHEGLAWALERQLQGILTKQERVGALRRLADLHGDKLDRPRDALSALNQLLELAPQDSKVQDTIQSLLEKMDDLEQLVRILDYRAQSSRSVGDRLKTLRTLAHIMSDRLEDPGRAAAYWEEVRTLDAEDDESLEALSRLYDRTGRNDALQDVLRQRIERSHDAPPAVRAAILRQLASLLDQRLGITDEAVVVYEQLSTLLPADRETLEALTRLYNRLERWGDLVRVLGRQIELADDPEQSVALAFKQGDLLEEKLGDRDGAALIFEHIIADFSPGDLDAHRRLKDIQIRRGDWRRACEVAERELFLTAPESEDRLALALEIAALWREKVKDDQRAALSYERVLELDGDSAEALGALRRLYHRIGSYTELVKLAPALFATVADDQERRVLLLEIAEVHERNLGDPEGAFEWYRRAYDLYPVDGAALEQMRRLAEQHWLWEELITTFVEARKRAADLEPFLLLTREVALIAEERLGDPARAFRVVQQALQTEVTDEEVVEELERLAAAARLEHEMLEVYDRVLSRTEDDERRRALLRRRAAWAEQRAEDPATAMGDMIRLFALAPGDDSVLPEIERLAAASGRWEDVITVHGQRLRALDDDGRLQTVRHVASLLETQIGDLVRAFRAHLLAFTIRPTDMTTLDHLWRLAGMLQSVLAGGERTDPSPDVLASGEDEEEELEIPEGDVEVLEEISPRIVIEATKRRRPDGTIEEPTLLDATPVQPTRPPPKPPRPMRGRPAAPPPTPPPGRGAPPPTPAAALPAFAAGPQMVDPWEELVRAYRALPAATPSARIQHLLAAARVWLEGCRDPERALQTLAEAATIDLHHVELQQRLAELAEQHDRFDVQLQIYRDALDRAADAESLIQLHLRTAELLLGRRRLEEAEHHFGAVLAIQPENQDAARQLTELYRSGGRWSELAALRERQLEALWDALHADERKERLRDLADLYQQTLHRPFEAVDFLVRLSAEDPNDLVVLQRLADLYEELSIWPKLIEAAQALLALTPPGETRAALLMRVARVYNEELELPDQAIGTYQLALVDRPDDDATLLAVEQLYERHDRLSDLIAVLRTRVDLAAGVPAAARPLLVRLAAVLERAESPADAAACLERARELGPPNADIEEALARVLVQSGQAGAALALMQHQVQRAKETSRPPEEVASLLVRLARIEGQQVGDAAACRASLEEALALQPRSAEVLEALADFHGRAERWPDYVETRLRLVDAGVQGVDAVATLVDAARTVDDKLGDRPRATALYERVLEQDPSHLPAIDALIEIVGEDLERREELLRLKLDLVTELEDQTATRIALGRTLRARGAPPETISTLYRQALELDPANLPALDALSELLVDQGELEAARALLASAVESEDVATQRERETGRLYYRLGQIYEQLDRSDEGHGYLVEALRLDPKNLLLRIAVGMNRFRGQHWREALRHLQEVAEAPEARRQPAEATEALFAAGQCEAFLRRNDRAAAYYLAALELSPTHLPALRELARVASGRGDWTGAADLMQRQRRVVEDREERCTLLRVLGDLYLEKLEDTAAAGDCFEELLDCLPDDEAERLEVLPRVLPVLRQSRRHRGAALAAESLAGMLAGKTDTRDMLLVSADEWEAVGDLARAAEHRQAALRLDPSSLAAAQGLARALEAEGRLAEVIDLLGRFLASQLPPAPDDSEGQAQRAALHAALGRVQRQFGDDEAAITSLERSLEIADELAVREQLAELYGDRPERTTAALQNHRRLLLADVGRVASLRALARAAAPQTPYRAYCLYQVLRALEALDADGEALLAAYDAPALHDDAHYSGEISDEERLKLLSLPEVQSLSEVFALLWEAAPTLLAHKLEEFGVTAAHRVSPVADTNLAKVYSSCARALGLRQTGLYLRPSGSEGIQIVGMAPPAVIVASGVAEGHDVPALRFLIGRALELTQPAYILAAGLERGEFARLISSVLRAFHPRHMRGRRDLASEAMEQAASLRRAMPFKIARRLGELFREQQSAQFDSGQWRQAVQLSANRAGLVLCGELGVALRLLREEEPALGATPLELLLKSSTAIRDLTTFAASDAFYACRVKLGLAGSG